MLQRAMEQAERVDAPCTGTLIGIFLDFQIIWSHSIPESESLWRSLLVCSQCNPIKVCLIALALLPLLVGGCSKRAAENPFTYPFIKTIHLHRQPGKPYSDYKALYLLTEDFEPIIKSQEDLQQIQDALGLASDLTSRYSVPWAHCVYVNVLAPVYIGDDPLLKD